jgi:hypothetical protein
MARRASTKKGIDYLLLFIIYSKFKEEKKKYK